MSNLPPTRNENHLKLSAVEFKALPWHEKFIASRTILAYTVRSDNRMIEQETLADMLGCSMKTVNNVENELTAPSNMIRHMFNAFVSGKCIRILEAIK